MRTLLAPVDPAIPHAKHFGIDPDDIPDDVRMLSQERIYTSPIWYTR